MIKSEYSIKIDAPIEKVFEYINDDDKLRLWLDDLVNTEYPDGVTNKAVGVKYKQQIRSGQDIQEYEGEITDYNPPYTLGARLGNPEFTIDVSYRLTAVEYGTSVSYNSVVHSNNLYFKILAPLAQIFNKNALRKQMHTLKELAETK